MKRSDMNGGRPAALVAGAALLALLPAPVLARAPAEDVLAPRGDA